MLAATAAMLIIRQCWPAITAAEAVKTGDANTKHVIVQMLQAYHQYPALFLVAAFAAVVVAPIIEEFFFRVLLQGWLETMERRHRFAMRLFRPTVLVGVAPIVLSSLLFAGAHFHFARAEPPALVIAAGLIANAIGEIVAVTAVIVLVLRQRGVTAFDFGWAPEKLASDVGLGLLAYLAIYVPVYIIQFVCAQIMPAGVAPDPVALFILALVLGTLYYRTHRIVPSIVTHAAFNATTLLLLWGITPS
jgi:membrane protease YdiL (CAAX protease family)